MLWVKQTKQKKTCDEVCDNPEESLIEEIGWLYWKTTQYKVVLINPSQWYQNVKVNGLTIKQLYEQHAEPWQKELVENYRKQKKLRKTYLIVDTENNSILDGYHRLVAFALEGITEAKALDLSQES